MKDLHPNTTWEKRERYTQALAIAIGEWMEEEGPGLPPPEALQAIVEQVATEQGIELISSN